MLLMAGRNDHDGLGPVVTRKRRAEETFDTQTHLAYLPPAVTSGRLAIMTLACRDLSRPPPFSKAKTKAVAYYDAVIANRRRRCSYGELLKNNGTPHTGKGVRDGPQAYRGASVARYRSVYPKQRRTKSRFHHDGERYR